MAEWLNCWIPSPWACVSYHWVAPRPTQSFILPRSTKWVSEISENLVVKSKVPPRSDTVALRQLNSIKVKYLFLIQKVLQISLKLSTYLQISNTTSKDLTSAFLSNHHFSVIFWHFSVYAIISQRDTHWKFTSKKIVGWKNFWLISTDKDFSGNTNDRSKELCQNWLKL